MNNSSILNSIRSIVPAPSEGCRASGKVKVGLESSNAGFIEEVSILTSEDEVPPPVSSGVAVIDNDPLDIPVFDVSDDIIEEFAVRERLVFTMLSTLLAMSSEVKKVVFPTYAVADRTEVDCISTSELLLESNKNTVSLELIVESLLLIDEEVWAFISSVKFTAN